MYIEIPKIKQIDTELVFNDLQSLTKVFEIPEITPTLILGAKDDLIVPPKVLYDNFISPNVNIEILDYGKHSLGFTEKT